MRLPSPSSVFVVALAAALAVLPGCDSDDQRAGGDDRSLLGDNSVRLNAEVRDEPAEDAAPDRRRLAQQAERDVETLLALREQESPPADPPRATFGESPESADEPPRIRWNDAPSAYASRPPRPLPGVETRESRLEELGSSELQAAPALRAPAEKITVKGPPEPAPETRAHLEDLLSPDEVDLLLVNLRRALFPQSRQSDQPLRELMLIAATSLVDEETTLNPDAFADLTDREREMLAEFQAFFIDLREDLNGSRDAEEVITESLEDLRAALIRRPELALPNAKLCWRVGGFGDYDTFDRNSFLAHEEQQVILYLEIDEFTSVHDEEADEWETKIAQQLEIYSDRDHLPVWTEPWQEAVDVTTKRRRDFFTTQIITLPQALSVGRYHLKVRARDEHSGAEAETSIAFEMVADPRMAAKPVK